MNLEKSFNEKYERLTRLKPIPAKLAKEENGGFFWLYYCGMGQYDYHSLHETEQGLVENLILKKKLLLTQKTVVIPIIYSTNILEERRFKVITRYQNIVT